MNKRDVDKELIKEVKLNKNILRGLPDLLWLKDLDGVYLACNKRFEDFFGATENEIIGKTDYDFIDKELADFFRMNDQKALESSYPYVNEEKLVFANDKHEEVLETTKTAIYNENNELIGILGVGRNITEKRKFENRLKESEERFTFAMQGANDGLWDWNLETDEVYYSPRWKSMLGYEEDELPDIFQTWEKLVHPDDMQRVLKNVQNIVEGKVQTYEVEMRMHHKNGEEVHVLSRAFLVKTKDNKPIRLVGTHVDITQQIKLKEFDDNQSKILKMIATGVAASEIYDEIALMYEARNPGMRCSLLELKDGVLLHGGAPSMPQEYCDAVHGLKNGPNVGSCGTSTYLGVRTIVEDIDTDPKWSAIKHYALPHGMRSCWSEPIKNSKGKVLGAFGMYYDYPALPNKQESEDLKSAARLSGIIMEREQNQKRIRELAYVDELTNIPNRSSFYERLENLIHASQRQHKRFGLLYIDLDNFKAVNDTLGHDVGDLLLKEVSSRLKSVCRETEHLARLGGDEFCMLIEDINDKFTSATVAQRCLDVISSPMNLGKRVFSPGCSIGIAHFPDDAQDFSTIIKVADTALYAAKEQGKNRYAFYETKLTKQAEYHFKMEHNLREAIEKEELTLVYQPQININSGNIIGFEVLSRWFDKDFGDVSPDEFIPIIEKIGLMKQFTNWVLYTASAQAVKWKKMNFPPFRLSVNISPNHFLDATLIELVKSVIEETGILPQELELEVTENVVQTDEKNLAAFEQLRELKVLTAIDDFGTGYSSLASLKHLQVDCIKIDKYFIDEMLQDEKTEYLVRSMIELGHYMQYGIIAEGVETKEQLELLRSFACETVQGYYYSKPLIASEIEKYITTI